MSQAPQAAGPQTTRSEIEVAADTIAAIFGAKLLPMTKATVSEMSFATRIPVAAIRAGWQRREAGYWRPPSLYTCAGRSDTAPEPAKQNRGNRKSSRKIPADATEWICARKDCPHLGLRQPIDQFQPRYESRRDDGIKYGSRRTVCTTCRKRDARRHYLTLAQSEQILRFVVQHGDPCEGHDCPRCLRPILVGQEVCAVVHAVAHHAGCEQEGGRK